MGQERFADVVDRFTHGYGGSGDGGVDADFGGGSAPHGPLSYAELCGDGCLPATGESADETCGAGGAGGGASLEGDCVLLYDEGSAAVRLTGPNADPSAEACVRNVLEDLRLPDLREGQTTVHVLR